MPSRAQAAAKRKAQAKWRLKDRMSRKIEQLNVRVPIRRKKRLKMFAERLRAGDLPRLAFKAAFPDGYAAIRRADRN